MRPLGSLQRSLQSLYRKALPMFRYITSLSLEVSTEAGEKSVERGCETRSAGYRAEFWRPARCDTTLPGVGFMAPPYGRLGQPSRPRQRCHAGRSPMWIGRELLLLRQERSQRQIAADQKVCVGTVIASPSIQPAGEPACAILFAHRAVPGRMAGSSTVPFPVRRRPRITALLSVARFPAG
jgi:hypothetical protein